MRSKINKILVLLLSTILVSCASVNNTELRGTGDLVVIIERATGSVLIANSSDNNILARVKGLGDLSHASVVFSKDTRFAFVFGRDGGLTKIDLLKQKIAKRVMQSGNSIGGAISQDGKLIAVSNYKPGGVKIFNSSNLELIKDIKATDIIDKKGNKKQSKTVGLVDIANNGFIFSLWDTGEIWVVDRDFKVTKFKNIGKNPYDGLITANGRYYMAGLFGEDGMVLLDSWHLDKGVRRILPNYGKKDKKLPVYKMPHLEGWTATDDSFYVPGVGHHEVLQIDNRSFKTIRKIKTYGQPIFVMSSPTKRNIWINFAHPKNDKIQILDVEKNKIIKTLDAGKAVLHMEFTPRGENVWVSVRDENRIDIYDTSCNCVIKSLKANKPSGIFMTSRANKIGL